MTEQRAPLTLDPARTTFIVVHLQNDIVGEGGAFTGFFADEVQRNDTLTKARALTDAAREAGALVAYVRIGFEADYRDLVANCPLLQMVPRFGAAVKGSPLNEIHESVAPASGDLVITHQRTSALQGTPLDAVLRGRGVDTVVVLGVATNASVEDTARHANNLGYRVLIASDASSAGTREAHDATLASFALLGGTATNDELVAALANN